MRIAIDARLNAYRRGGIPQYTRHLLAALADLAPGEQFISLQHHDHLRPLAVAPNVTRRTVWTPPHHRWEQWTLPIEVLPIRPAVLHCPDFIAPLRRPWPAVVTIHDLAFRRYPDILGDDARAYYSQVGRSAGRAEGIIAVSEATRQDIVQFLDIPSEHIDVVYEAAAPIFRRMELRPGEVRVLRNVPVEVGTFMLFVSTLEPRKNLPALLKALRVCIDRRPDRDYTLVIAGGRGWRDEPIFATVRELRLADHVLFAGPVGQYDLRWLYNACRFYVNPSFYEGFGLPLLEAMACGAACLAADTSSLPEIGGQAAIYVPPLDVAHWADAMEQLWDDEDRRQELGRLGQARALRFSWNRAARETLRVYQRAVARRGKPSAKPIPGVPMPEGIPAEASVADQPPRVCLRCGTSLVAGTPQRVGVRLPDDDAEPLPILALVCPSCGRVELVMPGVAAMQDGAAGTRLTLDTPPPTPGELALSSPPEFEPATAELSLDTPPPTPGELALSSPPEFEPTTAEPSLDTPPPTPAELAPADPPEVEQTVAQEAASDPAALGSAGEPDDQDIARADDRLLWQTDGTPPSIDNLIGSSEIIPDDAVVPPADTAPESDTPAEPFAPINDEPPNKADAPGTSPSAGAAQPVADNHQDASIGVPEAPSLARNGQGRDSMMPDRLRDTPAPASAPAQTPELGGVAMPRGGSNRGKNNRSRRKR